MRFRQGAAEHGEILREDEDQTAVDGAVAGDDAVAGDLLLVHAEIGAAMLDKHIPFFERARVEQQFDPLTSRQLALGMLTFNPPLTTTGPRRSAHLFELR